MLFFVLNDLNNLSLAIFNVLTCNCCETLCGNVVCDLFINAPVAVTAVLMSGLPVLTLLIDLLVESVISHKFPYRNFPASSDVIFVRKLPYDDSSLKLMKPADAFLLRPYTTSESIEGIYSSFPSFNTGTS